MFRSIMATLSKAGKDTYDSAARTLWYLNYGNIVEDYDDYREGEDANVESTVEHSDTEADESDDEHSDPQSGEERINTDEYESDDEDANVQLVAELINADEYEADDEDAIVQLVAEPINADEYESDDDADDEADAPERPPFIQEKVSYRSWLPTLSTKWPYVSWKSNHTDLNGALVPYVRAPLQIEPVPVNYFNYPAQLTASRTDIYRLLNNRTMLQDLIYNGHLRLTPLPNIIPTQFLPVFQATLFGYSTQATVIRQLNDEYALQLGDLVLPLQDIQRALAPIQNPTETTLVTTLVPAQPNLVSTGTPGLPNVNNLLIFRLFNGIYKVGLNSYNYLVEARDYYFNNEDIDDTIQESPEALNSSWLSKWPTLNRLMRRDTSKIVTINQHITLPSVKPETVFRPIVAEDTVRSESPRTQERSRSSVPFYSE